MRPLRRGAWGKTRILRICLVVDWPVAIAGETDGRVIILFHGKGRRRVCCLPQRRDGRKLCRGNRVGRGLYMCACLVGLLDVVVHMWQRQRQRQRRTNNPRLHFRFSHFPFPLSLSALVIFAQLSPTDPLLGHNPNNLGSAATISASKQSPHGSTPPPPSSRHPHTA